jgi:ribosomal protein S18 acetylase RimI-like enzyme
MTVAAAIADNVVVQRELFYEIMRELPPLFIAEWEEAGRGEQRQQLNPAWDKYIALELQGILTLHTMRDRGKLIGYVFNIIYPHLHFADTVYGYIDALYVLPEYRNTDGPEEMLLLNELFLRGEGVARIQIAVPPAKWLYKLVKKLQYIRTEVIHMKWL